jgi:predicted MFS family arabinose efflux permease
MPAVLFALAVACFCFSLLSQTKWLWVVAVVLLPVSGAAFLVTPIVVMRQQRRRDRVT